MKLPVNYEIALTHILTRKRQTLIASLGVTVGIALYIFSNSIVSGFGTYSTNEMFKTVPHLRVYKPEEISRPLFTPARSNEVVIIANPRITEQSNSLINPNRLLGEIRQQPYVLNAAPQVNVDLFYSSGRSQLKGVGNGVNITEADAMFNIQSTMLTGRLENLQSDLNGIVIGKGISDKFNVGVDDNITVLSAQGVRKVLRIVGIFSTGNKAVDESKSYLHLNTAQQLSKESSYYVTDIYARVTNPDSALSYAEALQELIPYKVEDWKTSNADQLAANNIVGTMTPLISFSIMMVAAFGIYNIMNMTITQKMNDIAILKAAGFRGKDIVKIFVSEAILMGVIGTIIGLSIGAVLIGVASRIYIGPPVGYFPVYFETGVFVTGAVFGMLVSLGAGYFPARKAARVDPVAIFRK